ncbi:hypothetical protein P175DRAFT_0282277 [Aspergillus ochraceoroseus IBT 24754]|uniref:MARVEL domain-containing protein n=3 Tax=Aspergillus subgen. Nidulantes TaxID=2720870 RepID=A0A0F8VR37_9EURO|nr:uncharacterized protein P175DRAFT_0282277 [Aspergillus ochraceoroseus IBT 24754]KKK18107.1 hypothetical protein AOCH_003564 [Aspergillus ochraceoroseus]KKK25646.1 hypothetical protein ARAM_003859 [Aspergillus rambellii]PTU20356.1 hypothetical protein P175DRAFT_0282277 [Aspergillus ochraceoroseus IBT 24754]
MVSNTLVRFLLLVTRALQWSSAVIVMGLTSYFIHRGPRGQHITYQEIIAVISVVFFLPAFVSPFMPNALSRFVLIIDVVFSYLWLTSFIFAAQDYNWHNCYWDAPASMGCSKKKANEAFIFLAFIFTFFGMFLEVFSLWSHNQSNNTSPAMEKNEHGAAPAPLDGPSTVAP